MEYIYRFLATWVILAIMDSCWIGLNLRWEKGAYHGLLIDKKNIPKWEIIVRCIFLWAVSATYIAYQNYEDSTAAFFQGTWLGLVAYLNFNITAATVTSWPEFEKKKGETSFLQTYVTSVDTGWGMVLFGLTALFAHLMGH